MSLYKINSGGSVQINGKYRTFSLAEFLARKNMGGSLGIHNALKDGRN